MCEAYQVKIDTFEGPLDLLLHLVNQYEIDIYEVPMAEICEQYMEYIHTMQRLELNIASEYLVMAATLLAIKSQMLLPKQEIDIDIDDYEEDPHEQLIERLIEYRKYKNAAKLLQKKELDANQIFTRAPLSMDKDESPPQMVRGDVSIYDMLHALGKIFERKKWNQPLDTKIQRTEVSIEQRMDEVLSIVKHISTGVSFDQLFPYPSRSHIVVTFIAILELMKSNTVYCKQKENFAELYVFYMLNNR